MALPPLDATQRRNLMLGTLVLLLGGYLFYSQVYTPRSKRVARAEAELTLLENQNAAARMLTRDLGDDAQATLAGYRRQLEAVEGLIPSSEELPDLLDAISAEAQRTGVEISLIQPTEVAEESYYTRRVYDMAVIGRYHDIGDFLTRVASLPRIVTPIDLTLAPVGAGPAARGRTAPVQMADPTQPVRLEARFSIETYVIPTAPTENADADADAQPAE
jgi:type IV pilus assembly protein PilO